MAYIGLADPLKRALATDTESGGRGDPTYDTKQAIAVMHEKHGIACDVLHGFKWDKWTIGTPTERLQLIRFSQSQCVNGWRAPKVLCHSAQRGSGGD